MSIDPWLLLRQARTQLMRTENVLRADLQRIRETVDDLDEALELHERTQLRTDHTRLMEILEQNYAQVLNSFTPPKEKKE